MKYSLNCTGWQMRGYWPWTPLFGRSMETGVEMGAVTDWMPAEVPGCVMADLVANGIVEDPYFERNSLKCEWVSNRWWAYRTEFTVDESCRGQDLALVFLGVDYRCHILLNGLKLCEHEGMSEPIRLDVTTKVRFDASNALEVVLESAPDEMGQIGYTSRVRTQTSRFGYKWDYATRMLHQGIWQDVYLEVTPGTRIENVHVITSLQEGHGIVKVHLQTACDRQVCRAEVELSLAGMPVERHSADIPSGTQSTSLMLPLDSPQLWWPNGYGDQPLYDLRVRLWHGDTLGDEYTAQVGIRSLEYEHNDGAPGALPYVVRINGIRIYLRGANISPLDHMIGSVGEVKYAALLERAVDMNANIIRVWGGGITEKDAFYRLCDRLGILVWQEFNQSSSGIDNVPPKDQAFLELLRRNATASVLARRNHVCLTFWNGGNELMDEHNVPSTYEDTNIALLKAVVDELDPQRLFLPTSASGPQEFLDVSLEGKGCNHDVHGPWKYEGIRRHYELYNLSDSLLHSEFGADAFTNPEAARRFLSNENLRPTNVRENLVWRHHGEWWDTTQRDKEIFGELTDLPQMMLCSQFLQAESLRYSVESNRRRAFQNSGSIIWQLNEPWPNLLGTCLVDYYGQPKGAYWWVAKGYEKLSVSLKYDGLYCAPGSAFTAQVWLSDNACAFEGDVMYRVLDLRGKVLHSGAFAVQCGGRHSVPAGEICFNFRDILWGLFIVELSLGNAAQPKQYLFSSNMDPVFARLLSEAVCTEVRVSSTGEHAVSVENPGDTAAVFVRLSACDAVFEDNGFTLLPGESRTVRCRGTAAGVTVQWLNSVRGAGDGIEHIRADE